MRIFNPDGSEAEKSGNGLRIFAKWLYDTGRAPGSAFDIELGGGSAAVEVREVGGRAVEVTVEMGPPVFREDLPTIEVGALQFAVVALSIGNPHCVILRDRLDVTDLRRLGPLVERNPAFPNRTNVQLARATARDRVELLIWERGAGETQASGSSACAVVAACHRLGLVDTDVTASMPGRRAARPHRRPRQPLLARSGRRGGPDHPQPRADRPTPGATIAAVATAYFTLALDQAKEDLAKRGVPIYDFGVGDPNEPTPAFIRQALIDALDPVSQYPTVVGQRRLRQAIAGWAQRVDWT